MILIRFTPNLNINQDNGIPRNFPDMKAKNTCLAAAINIHTMPRIKKKQQQE